MPPLGTWKGPHGDDLGALFKSRELKKELSPCQCRSSFWLDTHFDLWSSENGFVSSENVACFKEKWGLLCLARGREMQTNRLSGGELSPHHSGNTIARDNTLSVIKLSLTPP